jgi:hypothetical protein
MGDDYAVCTVAHWEVVNTTIQKWLETGVVKWVGRILYSSLIITTAQ